MARPTLLLLGIVALYLGVRALVLWTAFDTVVIPNYELMPMGNLAKVLSEGWRGAPVTQYYDNCGGHLATGALAAPLFVLFGDGYLILKLVPLLLGVVDLLLIWSILHRGFGLRAAVVGALLFTLGPPTLFKYSLLAKGNHFEGLTLQLACFWAFQRMHLSQRPQRWLHALALLGGLAVTIYLGAILVLFALGITHLLIRGIRPSLGDGVRALPGLLVGLSPLAFVSLASQNRTLKLLEAKATGEGVSNPAIERLSEAVHALPVAGFYPDLGSIPGSVAGWWSTVIFVLVWGGVLLCSLRFGLMAWRTEGGTERKRYEALRLLPLVLYLPGFYYSYTFGSFQFKPYGPPVEVGQYRYFVPHFTFAALLVGATVGLLRRLGLLIGALAVAPSVFLVTLVDWSFERTGAGLAYEGYDLATYSNVTLRDVFADPDRGPRVRDWDLEHEVAWVLEFDVEDQRRIAVGMGHLLAWADWEQPGQGPVARRLRDWDPRGLTQAFPAHLHEDVARGAGAFLRRIPSKQYGVIRERLAVLETEDAAIAAAVGEGLALPSRYVLSRNVERDLRLTARAAKMVPPPLEEAWARGRGVYCGRLLARGIEWDRPPVEAIGNKQRPTTVVPHWFGVGWGFVEAGGEGLPPGHEGLSRKALRALEDGLRFGRERRRVGGGRDAAH